MERLRWEEEGGGFLRRRRRKREKRSSEEEVTEESSVCVIRAFVCVERGGWGRCCLFTQNGKHGRCDGGARFVVVFGVKCELGHFYTSKAV